MIWRMAVAAAVVSVLLVAYVWNRATTNSKKGSAAGRLIAFLMLIIVGLVLVGFKDPSVAGGAMTGFVNGISTAASGVAHFLGDVFHA
jgi:putative flippase GtrA